MKAIKVFLQAVQNEQRKCKFPSTTEQAVCVIKYINIHVLPLRLC